MRARGAWSRILLSLFLLSQTACGGLFAGLALGGSDSQAAAGVGLNLFTPEQDIELGKLSADETVRQLPLVRDERTTRYVQRLGEKLAAKAPGYQFHYKFFVVASSEVNAFALPGGYVFVNEGAIAAARDEGELAGVLAHEIAHVALRHGTNQASKTYLAKTGIRLLDAITGGRRTRVGSVADSLARDCAGIIFARFNRASELQADSEGARIMAAAGYDPLDMSDFFARLGAQGGEQTPESQSDHPDPASRVAALGELAPTLPRAPSPVRDTEEFRRIKSRLNVVR